MNLKKKTQLHFLINLIVIVLITIILTSLFASQLFVTSGFLVNGASTWIVLLASFVLIIILYLITTATLGDDKSKIGKTIFPLLISSLLMAFIISFTEFIYESMEIWNSNQLKGVVWYILIILFTLSLMISFPIFQIYATKFIMASTTNNIADELIVNSFVDLSLTKSELIHRNNYSLLYSKNKFMIIKFISIDDIERKINLNEDERSSNVKELIELKSKFNKKLEIESKAVLVYLSNNLPKIEGETIKNFSLVKRSNLFKEFKGIKEKEFDIVNIKEELN